MNDNKRILFSAVTILTEKFIYFENTFYSLVQQSYPHWELVIISYEDNKEALSEFKNKFLSEHHQNINIFYIDECKSYTAAMNIGFRVANGDYIIFLDQFDKISEDYFAYVSVHHSDDEPKLYYSNVIINYEFTFLKRPLLAGIKNHPANDEFLTLSSILNKPTISSLSFLFPKNMHSKLGSLKEAKCDFPIWDYIIRASNQFLFHKMDSSQYQLTIKINYDHPKVLRWNRNKITNFKYLFLHDAYAKDRQCHINYINLQNNSSEAVYLDEYARSKSIVKICYNQILFSVIIKCFKFAKYIVTRMR